jgi:hypothetical protein
VPRSTGAIALARGWDARFPAAVLLVDRAPILKLLMGSDAILSARIAVVCANEEPGAVVASLKRGFRAGERAPVVYIHDAATVLYPFTIEPVATLARRKGSEPLVYRDLGLPPLGATPRRFGDATLPRDEPLFHLEAIPATTLVRYCIDSALRLARTSTTATPATPGAAIDRADRRRAR